MVGTQVVLAKRVTSDDPARAIGYSATATTAHGSTAMR